MIDRHKEIRKDIHIFFDNEFWEIGKKFSYEFIDWEVDQIELTFGGKIYLLIFNAYLQTPDNLVCMDIWDFFAKWEFYIDIDGSWDMYMVNSFDKSIKFLYIAMLNPLFQKK